MKQKKTRNSSIEGLKLIGICAIVVSHVVYTLEYGSPFVKDSSYVIDLTRATDNMQLQSLVIDDEDETEISKLLKHCDITIRDFVSVVAERQSSAAGEFIGTQQGFLYNTFLDKENIIFFSVPYDRGWSITVNGKEAELYETNCGLMGIRCDSGLNAIKAIYKTKGQKAGNIISAVCVLLSAAYVMYGNRNRIRRGQN